jgi:hypothetical protein
LENVIHGTRQILSTKFNTELRVLIDRRFDRKYGVDTAGLIGFQSLDVAGESKTAGVHYEPSPVPALRAILKSLKINHRQYSFVDYGSGKGRVLLLASDYPYRQVIGIEIANSLHAVAQQNIEIWKRRNQHCGEIKSLNMDAREFELPDTPLVIFFFTPFFSPVIDRVIEKIKSKIDRNTGEVLIIYYGTNQRFVSHLKQLGLQQREIYSKRPLTALSHYRGLLFYSTH